MSGAGGGIKDGWHVSSWRKDDIDPEKRPDHIDWGYTWTVTKHNHFLGIIGLPGVTDAGEALWMAAEMFSNASWLEDPPAMQECTGPASAYLEWLENQAPIA